MKPPQDNPHQGQPIDPANWLSALPDDVPISDINIPGSHNAAAINTQGPTRWACQRHSITEQLQKGIRLLDIRLKPKRRRSPSHKASLADDRNRHNAGRPNHDTNAPEYYFLTCHGHLGPFGANEFQSLESLLEECTNYLKANPRETIIMTIRIDDWRQARTKDHSQILKSLKASLSHLPLLLTPKIPTLKDCRGRIFLINRINDDPALGVPITIPDNTPGTMLQPTAHRQYEVYIQDQYKRLNRRDPEAHKFRLTIEAQEKKPKGAILLNFASGTKPFGRFVYIMQELSAYLVHQAANPAASTTASQAAGTKASARSKPIGWLLLDYPFGTAKQTTEMQTTAGQGPTGLIPLIIASNYPPASSPTHYPAI